MNKNNLMTEDEAMEYIEQAEELLKKHTTIPAVEFHLTENEPDIFTSKIGGTPYLAKDMEIPVDTNGRQMKLLAQVDCELLSELPDYPHQGILQFWLSTEYPWEESMVIYHQNIDKSVAESEVLLKIQSFVDDETYDFPVIDGGYGIKTNLIHEAISTSDERCGKLICKYLYDLTDGKIYEEYENYIDDLESGELGSGHKFGGYHYDPQSWSSYEYDPEFKSDIGTDNEMLLLFQLEYEHNLGKDWREGAKIVMGDCGVMHFFIRRKDLKSLNFDNVMYDWSCS